MNPIKLDEKTQAAFPEYQPAKTDKKGTDSPRKDN